MSLTRPSGQPWAGGAAPELSVLQDEDAAVLGADPEAALGVLVEGEEAVGGEAGCGLVEGDEVLAVEADEAAEGGQPEVAVAGLDDVEDGVLGEAVL